MPQNIRRVVSGLDEHGKSVWSSDTQPSSYLDIPATGMCWVASAIRGMTASGSWRGMPPPNAMMSSANSSSTESMSAKKIPSKYPRSRVRARSHQYLDDE
jgi:hypothetical protein